VAAALALVLGLTPRAGAKPPDLPAPIIPDCAPADDQQSLPAGLTDEGTEGWHEGLTMGDRCAAMRTLSRCVLFALHPLSAVVRPDRYCEFDEEPPYPVIRIGNSEVSVRDLVRNAAATLCSGPFGPVCFGQTASESPKPTCPAGGMMPAGNYCPQTHECPAEMKCPASGEPQSDPDNEARAHKAQELLIAAQIATQVGDLEAACAYYRTVCAVCPGTCCAWEAAEHIRSLQATLEGSADDKQQEEQNVCPSAQRAQQSAEPNDWCKAACECCATFFKILCGIPRDPTARMNVLLNNSEDLRQIQQEWERFWSQDQPSHLTYDRVHGGIRDSLPPDPDKILQEQLKQAVSIDYTDKPLRDILDELRTRFKINIFVDNFSLQQQGISLDQPVSIKLEVVSLKSVLNLVLSQVRLVACVKEGVVVVTTPQVAQGPPVPKVYGVADLIKAIKQKGCKGDAEARAAKTLVRLVEESIAPESWASRGGAGTVQYFPRKKALVICQDAGTQEQVVDLLTALRRLHAKEGAAFADSPYFRSEETATPASGEEEACEASAPVIAAYDISDLVSPSGEGDLAEPGREEIERGEKLMARIKETIAPTKWAAGSNALEYCPETRMLVVRQPQEIQEQVAQFLADLREPAVKQTNNEEPAKNAQGQLCKVVYHVSDLLTTYGVDWERKTDRLILVKKTADPEELIRLIQEGVAPESWAWNGGKGTISYEPISEQLLVEQTPEVQQAIREFLDARRHEIELHKQGCERQLKGCKAEPQTQQLTPPACSVWQCGGAAALLDALAIDPPELFAAERWSFKLDDVSKVLDACHKALKEGRLAEAEMLASRALCLDPMRVKLDPMVSKMLLLNQVLSRAVTIQPLLPAIDLNIVRAYNEILEMVPPRLFIEVHETGGGEEAEEAPQARTIPQFFVEDENVEAVKPSLCFDFDQTRGRVRCQLQFGFGTLCFVRDEDGHNSVELALPADDR
jgi:hypothetical protein